MDPPEFKFTGFGRDKLNKSTWEGKSKVRHPSLAQVVTDIFEAKLLGNRGRRMPKNVYLKNIKRLCKYISTEIWRE